MRFQVRMLTLLPCIGAWFALLFSDGDTMMRALGACIACVALAGFLNTLDDDL